MNSLVIHSRDLLIHRLAKHICPCTPVGTTSKLSKEPTKACSGRGVQVVVFDSGCSAHHARRASTAASRPMRP